MKNSQFAALALTGLLSAVSLSSLAATSTGPTNPDATTKSQESMGTGLEINNGAVIENSNGADPHTKGHDVERQAPAAVGNGKMGPSVKEPNTKSGDDSNVPGAPKPVTP